LSARARLGALLQRRIVREAVWVAGGQLAQVAARLVGLRILTDLVAPAVYGEVALLLGVATLAQNLLCMPILTSCLRFYPDAEAAGQVAALRGLVSRLLLRRTRALVAAVLLCGSAWVLLLRGGASLAGFGAVALLLALDVMRLFETTLQNAARRQVAFSLWGAADAVARPLFAIGAILLFGPHAAAVILGYAVGLALSNAAFRGTAVRGAESGAAVPEWEAETRRVLLHTAAPLAPLALLEWIMVLSDRYLLAGISGTHEAGVYAAGYGLGSLPFIVAGQMLTLIVRPVLFDAVSRGDRRRERRVVIGWLLLLSGILLAGLAALALLREPIVQLVLGEAFWGAAPILPWIGAAYSFQSLRHVFDTLILGQGRTRRLLANHVVAATTATAFYLLLIPTLGALGAAIGTTAGMAASLTSSVLLSGALPLLLRWRGREGR
jgi:O-antigen/teichoic acid export membrane protein